MKVSIITIVLNARKTIASCIESVLSQTYSDIEYIVVDGGSTDGTDEIIRGYGKKITRYVRGRDGGIYDAMNKGIRLASGDVVGLLNSDDYYVNSAVIEKVAGCFIKREIESLYGDLFLVDAANTDTIIRYWKSDTFRAGRFGKGWNPPHPAFFVRKDVYEKYGYFCVDLDISADFEIMLRFLEAKKISTYYLPEPLVKMRSGGTSGKSLKNIVIGNINCYKAFKRNGIKPSPFYFPGRILLKWKQYALSRNIRKTTMTSVEEG